MIVPFLKHAAQEEVVTSSMTVREMKEPEIFPSAWLWLRRQTNQAFSAEPSLPF